MPALHSFYTNAMNKQTHLFLCEETYTRVETSYKSNRPSKTKDIRGCILEHFVHKNTYLTSLSYEVW